VASWGRKTTSLKACLHDRKPQENQSAKKTEKEEKKRFWWNLGKKTAQEENNNFKPAFSPRFQTGADNDKSHASILGSARTNRASMSTAMPLAPTIPKRR
jgi:hypothetical protein